MKTMKKIVKAGRFFVIVVLLLLILVNAIMIVQHTVLGQGMPLIFGYGKAVVVTGSMEPAITAGDMVIIKEQDNYEVGDIVLYKANSYIVHRIVDLTEDGFITQGDANNVDDGEILHGQIVAKVVLVIPKIGFVADFLKSPLGILVIVIGLLALIELSNLVDKMRRRR